jgi:predicted GNAT superfamily acetyltransferase
MARYKLGKVLEGKEHRRESLCHRWMSEWIAVRKCHRMEEFQKCVALEQEIWGEADLEVEPATLFVVAGETGGQVLGAFDGDRMVGFTLAIVGFLEGRVFLHSHMTGVLETYRDRGVGRALKLFQREDALGRGIRLVAWTFDPLETRNGHFNLNRLGAISRKYLPNLYGVTTSPLHWGLPTDRLWVEWHLDSARTVAAVQEVTSGRVSEAKARIALPSELESWKKSDMGRVAAVQAQVREEFTRWFARGYAAVGVRKTAAGAEYVLAPWSDF